MSKRIWTDEQLKDIIDLYVNQGWTIKQIEAKYHSGHCFVSNYLHSQGVEINRRKINRLLKEDYFDNIDTPNKAYFLGLLFTDGSIIKDNQRQDSIQLELIETDKKILELLCNELNAKCQLSYKKRDDRENGTFTFSIRSNKISQALSKYNIIPNKTYDVNQVIIPDKFKIDYLRGFIDGDGSIYYSQNHWYLSICSHSKSIIEQVSKEINNLFNFQSKKIQVSNNVYKYTWNSNQTITILNLLYSQDITCVIERKFKNARLACQNA